MKWHFCLYIGSDYFLKKFIVVGCDGKGILIHSRWEDKLEQLF